MPRRWIKSVLTIAEPKEHLDLESMMFLLRDGQRVELATYDDRLAAEAQALGIPIAAT